MNITSKHKLILILVFTIFIAFPTFADEKAQTAQPTEPAPAQQEQKPEFKIEFSISENARPFLDYEFAQLSVRPSHVAYIEVEWQHIVPAMPSVEEILNVPDAAFLSEQQKAFLKTGKAIKETVFSSQQTSFSVEYIKGASYYYIYGLSQGDVVTTAKVFTELLLINANAELQLAIRDYADKVHAKQKDLQESAEAIKKQILDKRKLCKEAEAKAQKVKTSSRYSSRDIARKDMLEFHKMMDTLRIELAGIRVRLETIEKYKSEPISDSYRQKLQEMTIEQTIELSAAEAKMKEVGYLLSSAKNDYDTIGDFDKLKSEIQDLKSNQTRIDREYKIIHYFLQGNTSDLLEPIRSRKISVWPLRVAY